MVIKSAEFCISSPNYKKCPQDGRPEYAFIGRSNVGKSSLINMLTGVKGLAKTSGRPGKTQLINHFLINYATHGNPKNVILNRMAILFKFIVYGMLFISNSQLGFAPGILWRNALQYLSDSALLILLVSVESQFDSFNALRQELLQLKRKGGRRE